MVGKSPNRARDGLQAATDADGARNRGWYRRTVTYIDPSLLPPPPPHIRRGSLMPYAARRALPTKSIHSNAVPKGIWRETSYYLVERSQRGVVEFFGMERESIACAINPAR